MRNISKKLVGTLLALLATFGVALTGAQSCGASSIGGFGSGNGNGTFVPVSGCTAYQSYSAGIQQNNIYGAGLFSNFGLSYWQLFESIIVLVFAIAIGNATGILPALVRAFTGGR